MWARNRCESAPGLGSDGAGRGTELAAHGIASRDGLGAPRRERCARSGGDNHSNGDLREIRPSEWLFPGEGKRGWAGLPRWAWGGGLGKDGAGGAGGAGSAGGAAGAGGTGGRVGHSSGSRRWQRWPQFREPQVAEVATVPGAAGSADGGGNAVGGGGNARRGRVPQAAPVAPVAEVSGGGGSAGATERHRSWAQASQNRPLSPRGRRA